MPGLRVSTYSDACSRVLPWMIEIQLALAIVGWSTNPITGLLPANGGHRALDPISNR